MNFEKEFSNRVKKLPKSGQLRPSIQRKPGKIMETLVTIQMNRKKINYADTVWKNFYSSKFLKDYDDKLLYSIFNNAASHYNLFSVDMKDNHKYLSSWCFYDINENPTFHVDIMLTEQAVGFNEGCYLIDSISSRKNNMELDTLRRLSNELNTNIDKAVEKYNSYPYNQSETSNNELNNTVSKLLTDFVNNYYKINPFNLDDEDMNNFN